MSDLCGSFGLSVRRLRDSHCWSQEVLAEKADLNRSYIGEIERGKVIPSLITVNKLAIALDISMAELLKQCEQLHHAHPASRQLMQSR